MSSISSDWSRPDSRHLCCASSLHVLFLQPNCLSLPLSQVNCIAFHPVHGTLATVGGDGKYSFWDKDARTKLKTSEAMDQPISSCAFNFNGNLFAYSVSYDWSKVYTVFFGLLVTSDLCVHRVTNTTLHRRKMPSSFEQYRKR